jgi:hypothetical protein
MQRELRLAVAPKVGEIPMWPPITATYILQPAGSQRGCMSQTYSYVDLELVALACRL